METLEPNVSLPWFILLEVEVLQTYKSYSPGGPGGPTTPGSPFSPFSPADSGLPAQQANRDDSNVPTEHVSIDKLKVYKKSTELLHQRTAGSAETAHSSQRRRPVSGHLWGTNPFIWKRLDPEHNSKVQLQFQSHHSSEGGPDLHGLSTRTEVTLKATALFKTRSLVELQKLDQTAGAVGTSTTVRIRFVVGASSASMQSL